MKLPQLTLRDLFWLVLAGKPGIDSRDIAFIVGAGVSCLIAAALRLTLVRYGINKWVRSLATIVVFFSLTAGWVALVWRLWT